MTRSAIRGATLGVVIFTFAWVPVRTGPAVLQAPAAESTVRTWLGRTAEIEAHLKKAAVERIEEIGNRCEHDRGART